MNAKMRRRKKTVTIVTVILVILLILIVAFSFYMARFSMTIRRKTLEENRAWQEDHYDLSWYDSLNKEDYTVTSWDGYVLHVQLVKNPDESNRYILISHGYSDTRYGALKYAKNYLDLGFNIIIYDLRGHGLNEPTFCTYSVRERKDLLALILDSRERYPDMKLFGIHGESLGAAASVAVLESVPPVDFVVADCGFSDIVPVFKVGLQKMHLPGFLTDLSSLCAKILYGYSYSEMRPIESLKDNRIPILFIHGAEDKFIVPEHSKRMKEATKGYAELHLIPGADHARSVLTDPDAYAEHVTSFLTGLFPGEVTAGGNRK